ncbi:MAG: B12-binding domain-containing radical SAM protein [Candidatus Helarchaeota archaeon]
MKVLLIIYDNDSYIHYFPMGMAYIASALREVGHDVSIYSQDVYHYPESHLISYLMENQFDVVGISVIGGYYQYQKLLKISKAINTVPNRPFYMIGGHGPAPEPEYFLKKTKADVVVIGEGEKTVVNLLDALQTNKPLSTVKGIAFLEKNKLIKTPPQELIEDLDSIPFPAWDLFNMDYYTLYRGPHITNSERCFFVLSSRGCPFRCNFCYRMDKGIRFRTHENVIKEIKILKEKYNVTYIMFVDELVMASPKRIKELCNAIIDNDLNIKWACNGRLNYATPEILNQMKNAGCVFINYGIESVDDEILKIMNKNLTVKQIINGIEATKSVGISPGLNIIFGNIKENAKTLQKGVEFLLKYDDHAQLRTIRPVTPYPGCDLYYYAIKKGLLKDVEDFYENKHLNSDLVSVNFTDLTDDEFHKLLFEANKTLMENYFKHKLEESLKTMQKLYLEKDVTFRGFRHT